MGKETKEDYKGGKMNKQPKIPDWWRCENCKYFEGVLDFWGYPSKVWGNCTHRIVKRSISTNTAEPGFRPTFGCIYFELKEKKGKEINTLSQDYEQS